MSVLAILLTVGVGNAWGANSGLTASPGVFILDFYNSDKLKSTSGTGLTTANCKSHVTVQANATASNIISGVQVNSGTVQFDKNGGLTLGTGDAGKSQVTISVGTKFLIRKIVVVGARYDNSVPLYVAGTSVSLNEKGTAYASCTQSTTIETNFISSFAIKQNNGTNVKRSTLYTAVCEYGYRAIINAPATGSISAAPKTANENGAGWNSTLGAVVGLYNGQKVTLSATPPSGYELDAWTIKKTSDNSNVTASVLSGTTLTMPAYDVTISVTWRSTATCSENPSIGDASLNGSFNMTSTTSSIGVSSGTCSTGNAACDWTDYGFVWSDGTTTMTPTVSNNKVQIGTTGSATSWTGSVTPSGSTTPTSWTTGHTYYVRTYGKNSKASASYYYSETALTFTPRSVTFDLNGHGTTAPDVQYVNNGGLATDPSYSESVTGYTFGGWYKEAGCSNAWTFASDAVSGENKTLYAKWTPDNYTISLDPDLTPTTAGATSISVKYNSNENLTSAISKPIKTGWTFAGYFTAKNGGGTQIIDADGNVIAGVSGYTDASKNWIGTSDVTLYAKWTCTVTWSVNNLTNVYSAQTLTYNASSTKIASVPGPPSPASYCGQKFAGWTDAPIDGTQVAAPSTLFTDVAGSPELKDVGDQTFYAVFADYTTE